MLPVDANKGKALLEVKSGHSTTNYDRLQVFGFPSYFHVRKVSLISELRKLYFVL